MVGAALSIFLVGCGVALFTLSQRAAAAVLLGLAAALGAVTSESLSAGRRPANDPDR